VTFGTSHRSGCTDTVEEYLFADNVAVIANSLTEFATFLLTEEKDVPFVLRYERSRDFKTHFGVLQKTKKKRVTQ
jgi:transcriptional accessory protein Tex/SPT6